MNICVKPDEKRPSMRKVIVFYRTNCWTQIS